ncbi:hypothetical protein ACGRHY_24760 [Streptomyces sp. HK10]|uniref:hypothetical protein n=1 Tax=Streptomyces sp. HK10 TaxID=3373255 RepID=UPI00374A8512
MSSTRPRPDGTPERPAPPTTAIRTDLAFDHGAVSRFNAWFFSAFRGYLNHAARHHKQSAFGGIGADTVLEIGAGVRHEVAHCK